MSPAAGLPHILRIYEAKVDMLQNVYAACVDAQRPTPIPDDTYDALVCCAGFFQGLISPTAFSELLRITRPGGILMWNICTRYEELGGDFERYDDIVGRLG